jgi:hypothetical protein
MRGDQCEAVTTKGYRCSRRGPWGVSLPGGIRRWLCGWHMERNERGERLAVLRDEDLGPAREAVDDITQDGETTSRIL